MKKLLHERLREYGKNKTRVSSVEDDEGLDLMYQVFAKWSNEIERYYISRPRFEDGKPVQFGDEIDGGGGICDALSIFASGEVNIFTDNSPESLVLFDGETVKRPYKVLDADDVEIKEGEIVYGTGREQHRYKVLIPYDECNGCRFSVKCLDLNDDEAICHCDPTQLTHKEPDSFEKLRDDMAKFRAKTHFVSLDVEKPFDELLNRLSALIEKVD